MAKDTRLQCQWCGELKEPPSTTTVYVGMLDLTKCWDCYFWDAQMYGTQAPNLG